MSLVEEVIEATLTADGELQLCHQPKLAPGPVSVTIRAAAPGKTQKQLSDVIREIAAEQRARGFAGRSAEEILAEDAERQSEDVERDQELDAARRGSSTTGA